MMRKKLGILVFVVAAWVGPRSLDAQQPPAARKDSTAPAAGQSSAPVDSTLAKRGRAVADQFGCHACHAYTASEPKTVGPSLHGVYRRRSAEYLDHKLADPTFDNPSSQMPKLELTASQRRALVEFFRTLD